MKTVTDVNTVNQLLTYSKQAEAGIHQKAIQMLLGAGKHTYLLQESGKTINVDAKIKQLNDINWIEIGYKEVCFPAPASIEKNPGEIPTFSQTDNTSSLL